MQMKEIQWSFLLTYFNLVSGGLFFKQDLKPVIVYRGGVVCKVEDKAVSWQWGNLLSTLFASLHLKS